jgi:hypothetical protein
MTALPSQLPNIHLLHHIPYTLHYPLRLLLMSFAIAISLPGPPHSGTGSLPKQFRHYNDIDPITLFISLNNANEITPPTTPELHTTHTSLLHDCFLSAPLPFLRNRSWNLSKPPDSYHEAISRPDTAVWMAAMQQEYDSLETRKAFERTTLPPNRKAIGVR